VNELLVPEIVFVVAEQLNESDQSTPWMRTMDDEALQENSCHYFTEAIVLYFGKEVQK